MKTCDPAVHAWRIPHHPVDFRELVCITCGATCWTADVAAWSSYAGATEEEMRALERNLAGGGET